MQKIILFTSFVLVLTVADARMYRWVDSSGNTHYSNIIPASQAYLGHTELSKNGSKKKTVISAKEKQELTRIAESKKEQEKVEAERIKKEKLIQQENLRLLSIFSNSDEIIKSYNSKLRMSQLTIDLLKARHEKQSLKLTRLEVREEKSKNNKHKDMLKEQIDETIDNLRIYQEAITENILEKDRLAKNYKKTLIRYKKVKAKELASNNL